MEGAAETLWRLQQHTDEMEMSDSTLKHID